MMLRIVALTLLGTAVAAGAAFAQDYPAIKLRQNNLTPPTASMAQAQAWFGKEIAKRSGGKIQIENFWAGAAGGSAEMLKLVSGGALDIGTFPGSYFPAQMPFIGALSALPVVMPSAPKAQAIANALWTQVPEFQAEARANGVWPLFFQPLNEYHLLCTSPIRSLADLENKKIRSQGEFIPLAVKAIGAVPVTVLPGDFYEALQRGTVDCMLLPWDLLYVNRLHEVARFGSTISFGTVISDGMFFNLRKWESFPDNVKALMMEVAKDAEEYDLSTIGKIEHDALEKMKKEGVEVIEFPDQEAFVAKLPNFLDLWEAKMKEKGKGEAAAETVQVWKKAAM